MSNRANRAGKARKCPICGSPAEDRWRPFCSSRCADVDLSRWLSGTYAIPGGDADADEDGDEIPSAPQNVEDSSD